MAAYLPNGPLPLSLLNFMGKNANFLATSDYTLIGKGK